MVTLSSTLWILGVLLAPFGTSPSSMVQLAWSATYPERIPVSRPFVCTSIYIGSSSSPSIGRLHHRHRHRRPRLACRRPDQVINRSRVNHPPETSVVLCVMLRQERGLPLRCLLGQQHHRLSLSSPLHLHAIDSCRCTSLAHGILQLFKFFADFKHRRRATMTLSRTFFLCVVALLPRQL